SDIQLCLHRRTRTPFSQQLTRIRTEDENARGVGQACRSSDRPEQGEGRMLVNNTALVSETTHISSAQLAKVSAALQKQATRDFGPVWNVHATVDAFARLQDVPVGYWPIIVRDDIHQPGAAGVHLDRNGQPFALVQYDQGWALTASHEMLEMLADPFGNRLIAGDSPKPRQGRVE